MTNQDSHSKTSNPGEKSIKSLVTQLADKDSHKRQTARETLVSIGPPALPALIRAINHPKHSVRWESVKALGEIGDPAAAQALVIALEDPNLDVRWLAADALIEFHDAGLKAVLRALIERSNSAVLRESAHRVVHELAGRGFSAVVRPVIAALDGPAPVAETPIAARKALRALGEEA